MSNDHREYWRVTRCSMDCCRGDLRHWWVTRHIGDTSGVPRSFTTHAEALTWAIEKAGQ